MNGVKAHQEAALKRQRWDEAAAAAVYMTTSATAPFFTRINSSSSPSGVGTAVMQGPPSLPPAIKLLGLSTAGADMASAIVPPVTVVLEGRSICHRIHLGRHGSYQSLAAVLRRMFVDVEEGGGEDQDGEKKIDGLDLSNAVPGHMVAYEDMEDDLLLAGDLNWK